ncbi:MAG: CopD family protein [Pseudolabrys sp.]|nr:CopD family protein [Pseudolabrys sp.]
MLAALAYIGFASAASAHASLLSSDPFENAVIESQPRQFTLTFNESVTPLFMRLIDPLGNALSTSAYRVYGNAVVFDVPRPLEEGTHLLSWRVISADGHPVGGTITFAVGRPSPRPPEIESETSPSIRIAILIARFAIFVGLFVGSGGAFFRAWLQPGMAVNRTDKTTVVAAISTAFLATFLSVGLQGVDSLAASNQALLQLSIWAAGARTTYGVVALAVFLSLFLGLISLRLHGAAARALSLLSLLGVGFSFALSGHAASAAPRWLTVSAIFFHGAALAFWIGALAPLVAGLRDSAADITLARFSKLVPFFLVPLIIGGIALAIVQVEHVDALWNTDYGQILSLKLGLLVVLFGLAAINRWKLTSSVSADASRRWLRRSIAAELVIVSAILGVVSLWRFTPPPRALAAARDASFFTHIHTGKAMADVTITPARAGPVEIAVVLRAGDETPLRAIEVTAQLSNPQSGIEPIARNAFRTPDDQWRVTGLTLPVPGIWTIELKVLLTEFDLTSLQAPIVIAR